MNGDYYEGEWHAGVRHGRGMQQCADGSNYVSFRLCPLHPDMLVQKYTVLSVTGFTQS